MLAHFSRTRDTFALPELPRRPQPTPLPPRGVALNSAAMASKDIEIRNAVAAKCLDEVIVNGTLGMAVGAAAALTLVSKGACQRPNFRMPARRSCRPVLRPRRFGESQGAPF